MSNHFFCGHETCLGDYVRSETVGDGTTSQKFWLGHQDQTIQRTHRGMRIPMTVKGQRKFDVALSLHRDIMTSLVIKSSWKWSMAPRRTIELVSRKFLQTAELRNLSQYRIQILSFEFHYQNFVASVLTLRSAAQLWLRYTRQKAKGFVLSHVRPARVRLSLNFLPILGPLCFHTSNLCKISCVEESLGGPFSRV